MSASALYSKKDIHQHVHDLMRLTNRLEVALQQERVFSPYSNLHMMEGGLKAARDYLEWIIGAIEQDGF